MLKKNFFFAIFILIESFSQETADVSWARKVVCDLSGPEMAGRGYVSEGHKKAANYIEKHLLEIGMDSVWVQEFVIDVVCFEKDPVLKINGRKLRPGHDFVLLSGQPTWVKSYTQKAFNRALFIDSSNQTPKPRIVVSEKLPPVSYSRIPTKDSVIFLKAESLPRTLKKIAIKVEPTFKRNERTQNVIGFWKGESDSTIVIGAHYDHLGAYGKSCYFPGSLDNASGVALMLNLAKKLKAEKTRLRHNVAFVAFGAEEVGLLGSSFLVANPNPFFEIQKVIQVFNLDLVGTGKDGITIENAKSNLVLLEKIKTRNEETNHFPQIKTRENRPNSDHYPFSLKGIPSFFIYTLGEAKEYHSVHDNMNNVTFSKWGELLELLTFSVLSL